MLNKNKAITYLPSIILIALALNQLMLANFLNLSPWHGGGYVMFSTIEKTKNEDTINNLLSFVTIKTVVNNTSKNNTVETMLE